MNNYIVATTKKWNLDAFYKNRPALDGNWLLISHKDDLNLEVLKRIKPKYIFFPHWSWIVPSDITSNFNCVCFHMTDLPFGRGGSPLQNLISRGYKSTKITALKMNDGIDEGPIFLKRDFDISIGSAKEIFERFSIEIYEMISTIINKNPTPREQEGKPSYFERRTPGQSLLSSNLSIKQIHDHIRMLDGEGYPKSFLEFGEYRVIFSDANLKENIIEAKVEIRKNYE